MVCLHNPFPRWYLKDDNAIPAEFVLQRVSSIYPDFLSSNQEREFTARLQWWTEAALLQDIIRNGILETPGAGEMHQFSISGLKFFFRAFWFGLLVVDCVETKPRVLWNDAIAS